MKHKFFLFICLMIFNFSSSLKVVQAEDFATEDVANSLSNLLNEGKLKDDALKLIHGNKNLIKKIKSISKKERASLIKKTTELEDSIKKGTSTETIQSNLDSTLNMLN